MSDFNARDDMRNKTRRFRSSTDAPEMQPRVTNALDRQVPHTVRFIVDDMTSVMDVPLKEYLVLGRRHVEQDKQVDVDLSLFNAQKLGVSRYHAIIQTYHERVAIKDFNSSNGTYLNGFILKPMFGYRLRHDDELLLGRLKLKVHFLYD